MFLLTGINLLAWISNHMPGKVWDESIYQFPNFNAAIEVLEWTTDFTPLFITDTITYPFLE